MAKKRPLTRAEHRAARPPLPDARVYGVSIVDAGADGWHSRVIFFAATAGEAADVLRAADLHKRVIESHLRESDIPEDGRSQARENPGVLFLSRRDDDGWTAWTKLPPDYRHPSPSLAAKHPELRHPP